MRGVTPLLFLPYFLRFSYFFYLVNETFGVTLLPLLQSVCNASLNSRAFDHSRLKAEFFLCYMTGFKRKYINISSLT